MAESKAESKTITDESLQTKIKDCKISEQMKTFLDYYFQTGNQNLVEIVKYSLKQVEELEDKNDTVSKGSRKDRSIIRKKLNMYDLSKDSANDRVKLPVK